MTRCDRFDPHPAHDECSGREKWARGHAPKKEAPAKIQNAVQVVQQIESERQGYKFPSCAIRAAQARLREVLVEKTELEEFIKQGSA